MTMVALVEIMVPAAKVIEKSRIVRFQLPIGHSVPLQDMDIIYRLGEVLRGR